MTAVTLTPSGLERRLKRHFLKEQHRFFAVTVPGFEPVLEQEVRALPGVSGIGALSGGVEFSGPLFLVYHANLLLRSAGRVVMRAAGFTARSYPELFNKARRIPWERYLGFSETVSFEAVSRSSRLHHTGNIEKTVSGACVDAMAALGVSVLPDGDAALHFLVRLDDDECTVSIDTSGEPLHKRGWRQEIGRAPLRETVAAALLMQARWDRFPVIADPLCGSGTILVEASLLCRACAPGLHRTFAFERWPSFRPALWERIRREAAGRESASCDIRLIGSDVSAAAVERARRNALRAGALRHIEFSATDCFSFNCDGLLGSEGLIIANLPYGKRAFPSEGGMQGFLRRWGAHLKRCCRGWTFGFVTAHPSFGAAAGLPVESVLAFENGGLRVFFVRGTVS
jgi:putative N6-adenine-specific DNA methylase